MGTRSGDIDPAIVGFIADKEGLTAAEVVNVLNKKSGVYGLSDGISSDFRDLGNAADAGDAKAKDTLDAYSYRVAKYIGAYTVAMGGVDVIAFTAGVGENNFAMRKAIVDRIAFLGTSIDEEKNKLRGEEVILSKDTDKIVTMVVPTDEELAICRETVRLV